MSVRSFRRAVTAAAFVALAASVVSLPGAARAQTPTVLHAFSGSATDGARAVGGLIQGTGGNFYGTTARGGSANNGTVYQLAPDNTVSLLFSFPGGNNGAEPAAALLLGADGNFYGTTQFGGYYGEGTLFQLTPAGVLTVLVDFGGNDGAEPVSSLVLGTDGNFYGTTQYGGYNDKGTVFQYTAGGAYNVLFDFGDSYGNQPIGALTLGADGNFYGTTQYGGLYGNGTVFEITTAGSLTVLHDFQGNDGVYPQGTLALVPGGTILYGTTTQGGVNGNGTVFEITTAGTFTKLHDFNGADGDAPQAGLALASDGNFYGTTYDGGGQDGGTVFELTPAGVFTSLTDLTQSTGVYPIAPLFQGADGALYGTTTYAGGAGYGDGTIFRLAIAAPAAHPAFFNGETALANGVYYLAFPNGNFFGYYSFLADPSYIYHFDLGYEYVIDANDGHSGVYLYDFKSNDFFYTSPSFPFPYLYDFNLKTVLYYYAATNNPGHYTTDPRFFYNFGTGQIITK